MESEEVAVDNTAENGSATKAHQPTLLTASAPANQIGSAVSGGVGVNGIYSTVRGTPKTCGLRKVLCRENTETFETS